ncbi:paired small multidrug resistance pump [Anoxybacillus tepidamans]|uniref:Paired small multidrug resistance pump n=1 Tax=Anoxybacteroides tepidamans TaxID=265948 RepID=A0A7W8ISN3_9BACL|nr:multidrug efflux SMR transporter [Anoxybacillus tepidamans]MBB5325973.1 paired small multidrug resistance pump [Anoxybacillus tepidamans]
MGWTFLVLAGMFEVVGVMGMNLIMKHGKWQSYLVTMIGFVISFCFLASAMETLPMGLSYAVWTGIGTIGGTVVGMLYYGEPKDWKRISFIGIIIVAVIGLKWTS